MQGIYTPVDYWKCRRALNPKEAGSNPPGSIWGASLRQNIVG